MTVVPLRGSQPKWNTYNICVFGLFFIFPKSLKRIPGRFYNMVLFQDLPLRMSFRLFILFPFILLRGTLHLILCNLWNIHLKPVNFLYTLKTQFIAQSKKNIFTAVHFRTLWEWNCCSSRLQLSYLLALSVFQHAQEISPHKFPSVLECIFLWPCTNGDIPVLECVF